MRRLIVNPGTDSAWEIPLRTGIANLGSAPDNDIVIDHPSVAPNHCQFLVMDASVTVKDLGAPGGTFLDGQPVEEAALTGGQTLQIGEVLLRYEGAAAVARPAIPVAIPAVAPVSATPATPGGAAMCKYHFRNPARFSCPQCQGTFCEMCVSSRFADGRRKTFCRTCAVECTPLAYDPTALIHEEPPFRDQVKGSFKYPIAGDGLILIISGGLFFYVFDTMLHMARYALFGCSAIIIVSIFVGGYLTAYLRRILTSTAIGEDRMPDWPDISDFWGDCGAPLWQLFATFIFCFLPPIAFTIYAGTSQSEGDTSWYGWATLALGFFSCLYFPMAFLAVAMYNTLAALNPLHIVPSILKVWRGYTLTIVLLGAVLAVRWFCQTYLPEILPVPILPGLLYSFIGLYLLAVEMRILGLLYRTHKQELNWF